MYAYLWAYVDNQLRVMIIDVDAHQGAIFTLSLKVWANKHPAIEHETAKPNCAPEMVRKSSSLKCLKRLTETRARFLFPAGNGHEQDAYLLSSEQRKLLFILDIYNARNYPGDEKAKKQIDLKVELKPHTKDNVYLEYLRM